MNVQMNNSLPSEKLMTLHFELIVFKFGMTECKSRATPLNRKLKLDADSGTEECELACDQQLVVSLIYLTITWPDLSNPVDLPSQCMQTPRNTHLDCAKWVLRYASWTMNYNILYKWATPIRLEGYMNSDSTGYKPPTSWLTINLWICLLPWQWSYILE